MTRMMTPAERAQWQQLVDAHDPDGTCDCAECDQDVCPFCDQPVTDDQAASYCSKDGVQYHPGCHYDAGCRCPG